MFCGALVKKYTGDKPPVLQTKFGTRTATADRLALSSACRPAYRTGEEPFVCRLSYRQHLTRLCFYF